MIDSPDASIHIAALKCLINLIFIFMIGVSVIRSWNRLFDGQCLVSNNYIIMEVTRPLSNCSMCSNVKQALILDNPSKEQFQKYAYSGQPLLIRGALENWTALNQFNLTFFRNLYSQIEKDEESECQFLPFKTRYNRLQEILFSDTLMSDKSWYVGW